MIGLIEICNKVKIVHRLRKLASVFIAIVCPFGHSLWTTYH